MAKNRQGGLAEGEGVVLEVLDVLEVLEVLEVVLVSIRGASV